MKIFLILVFLLKKVVEMNLKNENNYWFFFKINYFTIINSNIEFEYQLDKTKKWKNVYKGNIR